MGLWVLIKIWDYRLPGFILTGIIMFLPLFFFSLFTIYEIIEIQKLSTEGYFYRNHHVTTYIYLLHLVERGGYVDVDA